jgi:hypothetical protein
MYRRSSDGIAVPASIRTNDGAIMIGTINCGMSGKLENLLGSGATFIEFVSKDGQQRFIAHHQIASVEPLATATAPTLPVVQEDVNLEAFSVLGIKGDDTLETAMIAFQEQLKLYNPEKWTGEGVPFEFSRYAAQKTRQLNMAFTIVKGELQSRADLKKPSALKGPMFGARAAG